ncbi:MAG: TolC family protein [bacterium]
MKKIIIFLIFTAIGLSAQSKKLTLNESIQLGMANSKEIKIANSKIISAEAEEKEYSAAMLPKLSLGASYTRLSEIDPFQITVPFSPAPIKISDAIMNNYNIKMSLQQPLFTGFRLSSLKKAAQKRNEAIKTDMENEMNKVSLQIQTAYWNYYKAVKVVELVEENSIRLKKHLEDTKNFLDNGLVTKNDYLKIDVLYSSNELQKITAENSKNITRLAFNKALGIELNSPTELDMQTLPEENVKYNYEEALNEAKKNRAELKSANIRLESVESLVTASKSTWYPNIYLFGNVYYNRPNQRIQPTKDEFKDTWDAGISLSWDLWDWGTTSAKSTQAQEQLTQGQTQIKLLEENIELEVYSNYLKVISETNKIKVSKKMLSSSEENYRITKEKYDTQLVSSSDLIDAETNLLDSQISYLYSLIDLKIANISLEKSIGRKIY